MPLLEIGVIEEINAAYTVWEQIQDTHRDKAPVQAVALVVRTKQLGLAIDVSRRVRERGLAQKALEAGLGDGGWLLFVHGFLVVVEQLVLFSCEACRFKCYLEAVCGFWWLLDIFKITAVDFLDKVERVFKSCFLSAY
jgi:hypothetical protein